MALSHFRGQLSPSFSTSVYAKPTEVLKTSQPSLPLALSRRSSLFLTKTAARSTEPSTSCHKTKQSKTETSLLPLETRERVDLPHRIPHRRPLAPSTSAQASVHPPLGGFHPPLPAHFNAPFSHHAGPWHSQKSRPSLDTRSGPRPPKPTLPPAPILTSLPNHQHSLFSLTQTQGTRAGRFWPTSPPGAVRPPESSATLLSPNLTWLCNPCVLDL